MQELYDLSKNLKTLRLKYHYTQQFVAESIGIACPSYQAYEWGLTVPTLRHFIRLAKLYDVTLEELVKGEENG